MGDIGHLRRDRGGYVPHESSAKRARRRRGAARTVQGVIIMFRFQRLTHQGSVQLALAAIALGTWLSGCGDDEEGGGNTGGKGGKGGTAGNAGNAGAVTGGAAGSVTGGAGGSPTGGAGGSPTGGAGGTPMAGNAGAGGATGGSAGSAGSGAEGGAGMGGEGGIGEGGMGGSAGMGMGGEGGSGDAMCATGDLSFMEMSMQAHDHLPINGMARTTILGMINTGMPLVFNLPDDGTNTHSHTLTFTAAQLTTLRNGGTIAMITSGMGGPAMNMHTHTYSISCAP